MEQLLAIAGALIVTLLGIVGFRIQKWIKSTDALTEAISDLRAEIATNQVNAELLYHSGFFNFFHFFMPASHSPLPFHLER